MEMVSAARMRRAQEAVEASRPYAERMADLVAGLARLTGATDEIDPLLVQRPIAHVGLIVITSDRGLAGPINANVVRNASRFILDSGAPVQALAIGRKGRDWLVRHGAPIVAEISPIPNRPTLIDVAPITTLAINGYREGRFDQVSLVYNQFVSTSRQVTVRRQILPVVPPTTGDTGLLDYIFEPSPQAVLSNLLPRYVEIQVYQAVLESLASEHAARMLAMHNATQNARDVVQELTLSMNKARQAGITKEILEIVSGAEALKG
jgi:F-type H+-transporting ATPase subunit gamma